MKTTALPIGVSGILGGVTPSHTPLSFAPEHTNAAAIEHALFLVYCLYEAILRYSDITAGRSSLRSHKRSWWIVGSLHLPTPYCKCKYSAYDTELLVSVRR